MKAFDGIKLNPMVAQQEEPHEVSQSSIPEEIEEKADTGNPFGSEDEESSREEPSLGDFLGIFRNKAIFFSVNSGCVPEFTENIQ